MSEFIEVKTAELVGGALDWAVAMATEAWTFAHSHFPTMTLDPTFSGVELRDYPRGEYGSCMLTCVLIPRNSMRQDPQAFCPSTYWSQGGPLIERFKVHIAHDLGMVQAAVRVPTDRGMKQGGGVGETGLIAAMRAIVSAKLGDTVQIPAGVML